MSAHVCAAMRKIWRKAGLYESKTRAVRDFLDFVGSEPPPDWERGMREFRKAHYDAFDQVVPPLLQSDDKLLRIMLIRHADPSKRRELNLLKRFAETLDPIRDEPELLELVSLGHKTLDRAIRERGDLTPHLRRAVGHQPLAARTR